MKRRCAWCGDPADYGCADCGVPLCNLHVFFRWLEAVLRCEQCLCERLEKERSR